MAQKNPDFKAAEKKSAAQKGYKVQPKAKAPAKTMPKGKCK